MFGVSDTSKGFGSMTNDAKQGMQFGKSPVFGTGGFSASASKCSFGREDLCLDATWRSAFTSSPLPLFEGSSGSKSDVADFPSVFGRASNTSGSNSFVPERNSFLWSEPVAASGLTGGTLAFGTNLTPLGSTTSSNVPGFGITAKAVATAPASGFSGGTFTYGSKLTPLGGTNISNVPVFGNSAKAVTPAVTSGFTGGAFSLGSKPTPFGSFTISNVPVFGNSAKALTPAVTSGFTGGAFPCSSKVAPLGSTNTSNVTVFWNKGVPGGGSNTEAYRQTPLVDNTGKNTAQYLQSKSAMHNYQSKSHEELRWEDYQCRRAHSWADSAAQPYEKISSNTCLPSLIGSNIPHTMQHPSPVSVEKPAFANPNVDKQKGFGTFTAPRTEFSPQLPAATFRKPWWALPQPALVSILNTPVPAAPSSNGQSLPSSPWFLEHTKPAQEPKLSLSKDPLQTNHGITFPTTPLDAASTPSKPVANQISPSYNVGDVQLAVVITNPFEGETRSVLSHSMPSTVVQHGISGMPVTMVSKPIPVRISSLLTCRKLSRSRIKIPVKKPTQIVDDPKVPFFCSPDEFPHAAKGHSWLIARESPKAWVCNPTLVPSTAYSLDKTSPVKSDGESEISPGNLYHDETVVASLGMLKIAIESEYVQDNRIISQISEEVEPPELPKLSLSDYYTKPSIEELSAKEKTDPEFLTRVKDFTVGRHGYGYIKFNGETDIRQLDITSILQFSHREISIYPDDTTKPPIGQGLNKAAEITLLNIKPINRNSASRYTVEEMADKFKMMLIQKCKENGAEFISYDHVIGVWKFSVPHFS